MPHIFQLANISLAIVLSCCRAFSGSAPSLLQHTFAAWHGSSAARIHFHGEAQCPRKCFEAGLHDVVGVHAIQLADVQGEATVVCHRHEELLHQLGVVAADLLGRDLQPIAQVRTAAAIQRHLHQRFIQRCHEMTEAVDAAPIAQGLGEGLAHGDAHILIGVVVVDMGVAAGLDLQVDQPMAADLVEHVVEKRHAGVHRAAAAAVESQRHAHIGFAGGAVDGANSL
jgi:hypothetical protein